MGWGMWYDGYLNLLIGGYEMGIMGNILGESNVMLDLETLGLTPGSVIVSIGAVHFNQTETISFFNDVISLRSSEQIGLGIDSTTLAWWMQQDDKARVIFNQEHAKPIYRVLRDFANFLPKDALLWGNGADFDNALLAKAYCKASIDIPWDFRNNRCYRTVKNMFPDISIDEFRTGIKHNSLDDAISQTQHLITLANSI